MTRSLALIAALLVTFSPISPVFAQGNASLQTQEDIETTAMAMLRTLDTAQEAIDFMRYMNNHWPNPSPPMPLIALPPGEIPTVEGGHELVWQETHWHATYLSDGTVIYSRIPTPDDPIWNDLPWEWRVMLSVTIPVYAKILAYAPSEFTTWTVRTGGSLPSFR